MPTLRLSQFAENENTFRVELALDNSAPVRTQFSFELSSQDQEDLRWYLEDYLQYPLDPAPNIAARVEARMKEIGEDLFRKVFESGETARRMWARLQPDLNNTRIQVITEVIQAITIPWELLRDPLIDEALALRARAFVRVPLNQSQPPSLSKVAQGSNVRILLVICRPMASADVPFRSVASRIIKSLTEEAREIVQLDVLRPPTFEQLGKTLREAKARGEPYHVVHFDGHGIYSEIARPNALSNVLNDLNAITLGVPRAGKHGYLVFENPKVGQNAQLVDGPAVGKLLVENDVPLLVLNACQSAFAEAPTEPVNVNQTGEVGEQVRAFGTLAQEVMDSGVAGIVAMRYVLYVETAKQFFDEMYAALARGQSLGEAVTFGRKQLATNPQREIAYEPIDLEDWTVPIVYEAAAIELFPRKGGATPSLRLTVDKEMTQRGTEVGLPSRPDVGFFGRDETLLALDRAFDSQQIVLLHAFAGSGKTTTAAEFARWYALTGGVEGALFFTSFERRKTLVEALNETIGRAFGKSLEQIGKNWDAMSDEQKRETTLRTVLAQVPVLWIWDNVEPIAGFPAGTPSAWSVAKQQELVAFLRDARETKAKFLLTSRRDERGWLSDLPHRIVVPPMPMQERVQLARALAEKFGHRITEVEDWRPLLQYTQGNPLTITVVVGQALRDGLRTRDQIVAFVERLRKGETAFADKASEGRSKSLGASLSYGFENAFAETERKQLALLHFFQGFVEVNMLVMMGDKDAEWCLPEVRGLTPEDGIRLLNRVAEIGLLTMHGRGLYSIHPALPWYFKILFDKYYDDRSSLDGAHQPDLTGANRRTSSALSATSAFVDTMAVAGLAGFKHFDEGNGEEAIYELTALEANLVHARQLARANGWWDAVMATMNGLKTLYSQTGKWKEWSRLVDDIIPDFVDKKTGDPVPDREEHWAMTIHFLVGLAEEAEQWGEAERLQRVLVGWNRKRAAPFLSSPYASLNVMERNLIGSVVESLVVLGAVQRELGNPECVSTYEEATTLSHRINDRSTEASVAFELGHSCTHIPAFRNLERAEFWYKRSLELRDERDERGQAKCCGALGAVAYQRFEEARASMRPEQEIAQHFNSALQYSQQALTLLPPTAVRDLATGHNQLANLYSDVHDFDNALVHWRKALRYMDMTDNLFNAAKIRFNIAGGLWRAGRLEDAREYAYAALENYETYGERAAEQIERTKGLIEEIAKRMKDG